MRSVLIRLPWISGCQGFFKRTSLFDIRLLEAFIGYTLMFKMPTPVISDQTFAHGRPLPSLFWIFSIHSFVYKYWYKDLSLENTWLGDRPLNFQFPDLYLLSRSRDSTICQNLDFATVSRSWNFNFCCQPVGTWNSWTFLFVPLYFMSTCCHLSLIFECCCLLLSGLIQSFFPDLFKFCVSSFFFHSHYHWKPKLHMKLELSPSLWGRKGQYQWHITTKKAF